MENNNLSIILAGDSVNNVTQQHFLLHKIFFKYPKNSHKRVPESEKLVTKTQKNEYFANLVYNIE